MIAPSQLGFMLRGAGSWGRGVKLGEAARSSFDETWEQPWGESRLVLNRYNQMRVPITELRKTKRLIDLVVRVFDGGVGFRFEFPEQT